MVNKMAKAKKSPKNEKEEILIRGIISPAEWDDSDNVTSIVVLTDDDEEYYISSSAHEEEMLDLIDEEVEVRGSLREHKGDKFIDVTSFKMISSDEDDFDDDYEDDDGLR